MSKKDERTKRIFYGALLTFALVAAVVISIGTYFTALSQYPTQDQLQTAARLNGFLADFRSVTLLDGSLVSDLIVAVPGGIIAKVLSSFYQINDPILWNIRFTPILPFALAQVIVALALIFLITFLVVQLARDTNRFDLNTFLFALMIILNFPILKAISKVLKYDALSTMFLAIALLSYVGYRSYNGRTSSFFFGKFCIATAAFFCALAYLEKDTSISVVILIVLFELTVIPFLFTTLRSALLCATRFVVVFGLVFFVVTIMFVPKILLNPRQFPDLFEGVPQYFVNIPGVIVPTIAVVLALAYLAWPLARAKWSLAGRWPAIAATCLLITALGILALSGSALIFQDNILYDPTIVGNDLNIEHLRAQSIYVSKPIADAAITTLDHSAWVQHAKVFYSMARAIIYTLPEISVLMIVAAAPLFLVLARTNGRLFETQGAAFALLLLFPAAMLAAYSLADLPFDPKYLVLAGLLLTIYGLNPVLIGFERLKAPMAHSIQAVIASLMVLTALSAAPSYLRYKNIFRDRNQENSAAIDMNHYIWWTWAGWGETAYAIGRYLESNSTGPVTVATDYLAPFYTVSTLKWVNVRTDFKRCQSEDELKSRLAAIATQSVDFLVVSKNMSNRHWCLNVILRRMRNAAVFVDVQQGFEYGWLFRFSDILATFRK